MCMYINEHACMHVHTHTHTHTHTHKHTRSHSLIHSLTHSLTNSHSLTHIPERTHYSFPYLCITGSTFHQIDRLQTDIQERDLTSSQQETLYRSDVADREEEISRVKADLNILREKVAQNEGQVRESGCDGLVLLTELCRQGQIAAWQLWSPEGDVYEWIWVFFFFFCVPGHARSSVQWVRWSRQPAAASQSVPKASCGHPPDRAMSGISKHRRWGRSAGCGWGVEDLCLMDIHLNGGFDSNLVWWSMLLYSTFGY